MPHAEKTEMITLILTLEEAKILWSILHNTPEEFKGEFLEKLNDSQVANMGVVSAEICMALDRELE